MKRWSFATAALAAWINVGCSGGDSNPEELQRTAEAHADSLTERLQQGRSTAASYIWPVPEGWFTESYPLPPPWYPEFAFTGIEELRFTPGFGDSSDNEWWAYDYLEWIESGPAISEATLEREIIGYYKGLADCGGAQQCDASRFAARVNRLARTPLLTVFGGWVDMYDAVGVPIRLNLVLSSVVCPRSKHRALLVSASPQPLSNPVWGDLLKLQLQFQCK